jgi:uncharacterized protein YndB with AHSA1/START domain
MKEKVTVEVLVQTTLIHAWEVFHKPEHIKHWYFADPSWHVRDVGVSLEVNQQFHIYMEAKDQSFGFDFSGTYQVIKPFKYVLSILEDGRTLEVNFKETEEGIVVTETFEIEDQNNIELQRAGWQSILNQYKVYIQELKAL